MTQNDIHAPVRRRLSDILNGGADNLREQWNHTEAAGDFMPLPGGTYISRIVSGELFTSKGNTPGYKISFKIVEGEHVGRLIWHDVWLTPAALPMTKRDLSKLGVRDVDQLEQPLPQGIRCKVKVTLRADDDGTERNRVRSFDVIGIDADPTADPDFAPTPPTSPSSSPPKSTPTTPGEQDEASLLPPTEPPSAQEAGL